MASKKKSRPGSRRITHTVFRALLARIPWLSGLARLIPARWETWLFPALILVTIIYLREDILNMLKEWHGPDIIVTALPEPKELKSFGRRDLLYEFRVNREAAAVPVRTDLELQHLFDTTKPIVLRPFNCDGKTTAFGHRLYRLSIISENLGSQTARKYSVMISFSDKERTDSGVRMLHVESDDFDLQYLYRQRPEYGSLGCLKRFKAGASRTAKADADKDFPMVRETYQQLELTRDVAILEGTLEARMFQTIEMVVAIPPETSKFAAIYNVDCDNCRWFYRTTSFAQVLRTPE